MNMNNIKIGSLVQHEDSETGIVIGPMKDRGCLWGYWRIWWASGHFGGVHEDELKVLKEEITKQENINA
jgi:hypothetical protein